LRLTMSSNFVGCSIEDDGRLSNLLGNSRLVEGPIFGHSGF
jgi:hypothetical protein